MNFSDANDIFGFGTSLSNANYQPVVSPQKYAEDEEEYSIFEKITNSQPATTTAPVSQPFQEESKEDMVMQVD